ncbi:MAG: SsrA-binding protein SmpB [Dehalococcoidales bacterium]|nr:SsrA-binding protein SmpB [Dehalococcoidales bacterium]
MAEIKKIATNRKALHEYHILEGFEAGIALTGTEIKSVRASHVSLAEAYVKPEKGEMWLLGAHIARYEASGYNSHEPTRRRRLLLHRKQISMLASEVKQKGLTIVPLSIYIKDSLAKVEVALAKGKKQFDKRAVIAKRDADREIDRTLKSKNR